MIMETGVLLLADEGGSEAMRALVLAKPAVNNDTDVVSGGFVDIGDYGSGGDVAADADDDRGFGIRNYLKDDVVD